MKRTLVRLVAATVAVVGIGVGAAPGSAADRAHDARHGGATGYTQVVIDPAVYGLLGSAGITPAPVGRATAFPFEDTLAARFPIVGYRWPGLQILHAGGLRLSAGEATITLRRFNIRLADLTLSGLVSGSIGNVGRVDLFRLGFSPQSDLGPIRLRLTSAAADALNATFGADAFAEGVVLGYATVRPFGGHEDQQRHAARPAGR